MSDKQAEDSRTIAKLEVELAEAKQTIVGMDNYAQHLSSMLVACWEKINGKSIVIRQEIGREKLLNHPAHKPWVERCTARSAGEWARVREMWLEPEQEER